MYVYKLAGRLFRRFLKLMTHNSGCMVNKLGIYLTIGVCTSDGRTVIRIMFDDNDDDHDRIM